jgi:soluble lytic murein transglycosylase-like protein
MDVKYYSSLLRSVLGIKPVREWAKHTKVAFPGGLLVLVLVVGAFRAPAVLGSIAGLHKQTAADVLITRAADLKHAFKRVDVVAADEIEPLARVIREYRNDDRLARRVATALVRESRRAGVQPDILMAVLLVENPWINPAAKSPVGALGLMQVMPGHRGQWKACPNSLEDIESNICYGAQIFRSYLREEHGRVESALLRYNGCVRGTNTPICRDYPTAVFARAGRATLMRRSTRLATASD